MTTDDDAQDLLSRLDTVVPRIDVRTSRVIPRARRRRALRRSAGTLVLAGMVVGAGWVAQAQPWSPHTVTLLPAQPTAAPSEPAEPTPTPTPTLAPEDQSPVPVGAWWYTLYRSTGPDGEVSTSETWLSPHQPGIGASNGDYANADSFGPGNVIATFMIDGAWVEVRKDSGLLPTDPAALERVFRASIEPDRRSGTDDEKVYGMAYDLLIDDGLPEGLRHAAWAVAAGLPGTTVTPGTDATGRPGEVLDRPGAENGAPHLVRDPATGLLLELGSSMSTTVVVEQRLVHSLPVEPSLESSGCTSWESC